MDNEKTISQASTEAEETINEDVMTDGEAEQMEDIDLHAMVEESLRGLEPGEVTRGLIIKITDDFVIVDVGYKSEGQIPVNEFINDHGEMTFHEGDEVDVLVESLHSEDGDILLSKKKAAAMKVWDDIITAHNDQKAIRGVIVSRVKGGFTVDIGIHAFLPGSQVDLRPVRDTEQLIGKTLEFRVLKYNKRRNNVVVSRRVLLEERRSSQRSDTLDKLKAVDALEGEVKNITDYGAFIDLGGIDGLLHITDMSWGKVRHPSDMLRIGDRIKVKVLSFDAEQERVSLGLKQLSPDPWLTAAERYHVGDRVNVKVVSLTDYGAFVELEAGVEGLIHLSEMSWTKKVRHASQVVNVGDQVEAVILDINPQNRRVSLGLKQVEPNPWDLIEEKFPVGSIIQGKIKNLTDFGIFIGIDDGIDGLVHISDLSWNKRIEHPSELFKKGQDVVAKVIKIDKENERFSLSIKDVSPDPWEQVAGKYQVNKVVSGKVTNVTDFGVFVELEDGVEGLVHVSEIADDFTEKPQDHYKPEDEIEAKVIKVNEQERKIGLSIKRLTDSGDSSRGDYSDNSGPFSSLGDFFKRNLEAQEADKQPSDKGKPENSGAEE